MKPRSTLEEVSLLHSAAIAGKFIVLAVLIAGGCTLLGDPIAEKVADVVSDYCKEPFSQRQVYRDTVNRELAAEGHSINVTCAGDP